MRVYLNTHVNIRSVGYGTLVENLYRFFRMRSDAAIVQHFSDADIELYVGQPYYHLKRFWQREAGNPLLRGMFTMFESTTLPAGWIKALHEAFDFVITPSEFCKRVFIENGCRLPISVVQLGVDSSIWRPPVYRSPHKTFNIIWQGNHIGDRKGGDIVQRIFAKIARPDWRLYQKANLNYVDNHIPSCMALPCGKGQIRFYLWDFTHWELLNFLHNMDVSVYPSRGEGFGLIPLEHAACGLPVILSLCEGHKEFADPDFFYLVNCKPEAACWGPDLGRMDAPDEGEIEAYLEMVYARREEALAMGKRASEYVHEKFTWGRTVDELVIHLNWLTAFGIDLAKKKFEKEVAAYV